MKGEIFETDDGELYYCEGDSVFHVDFTVISDMEDDYAEQLIDIETERVEWEALNENISETRKQLHELADKKGIKLEKNQNDMLNQWRERVKEKQIKKTQDLKKPKKIKEEKEQKKDFDLDNIPNMNIEI